MAESRQQRRARERAEAKSARRSPQPGTPRQAPAAAVPAPRRPRVMEVELARLVDDDAEEGDNPVTWHAEWALRDDSVATEDSSQDLGELIGVVLEDTAAQWGNRYDLTIEWELTSPDSLPEGQTLEGVVEGLGITLPRTVPVPLRKTALPQEMTRPAAPEPCAARPRNN